MDLREKYSGGLMARTWRRDFLSGTRRCQGKYTCIHTYTHCSASRLAGGVVHCDREHPMRTTSEDHAGLLLQPMTEVAGNGP